MGLQLSIFVAGRKGGFLQSTCPSETSPLFTVLFLLLEIVVSLLLSGLDLCCFWELCPDPPETKPGALFGASAAPILPHHSLSKRV